MTTAQPEKLDYSGIGRLRKKLKIKQLDVAKKSGISQALLSKYENGVVESPSTRQIKRIADAMGVSVEQIDAYCTTVRFEPQNIPVGAIDSFIPLYDRAINMDDLPFEDGIVAQAHQSTYRRPDYVLHSPHAYAVKINKDTMEPRYEAGETVIVDPTAEVKDGTYVFASLTVEGINVKAGVVRRVKKYDDGTTALKRLQGDGDVLQIEEFDEVHAIVGSFTA